MPAKKKPPVRAVHTQPELALINSLAEILNATGLSEIEIDQKGTRVRVAKNLVTTTYAAPAHAPVHAVAAPVSTQVSAPAAVPTKASDHPGAVKSPMVGTCYMASAPGAAPFISVGAVVKQGQTMLIIEAMKTLNQIVAPRDGKVISIFVDNGQPVEFGEALLVIE